MMVSHRELPSATTLPTALDERRIRDLLASERALERDRARRARLSARVAASLLGGPLDRALIAGADPCSKPALAARAAALTSEGARFALAGGLDTVLAAAQEPPRRMRLRPRHAAILANAALLRELATLLRGSAPVYAPGVALLRRLLCDGTGPLYAGRDGTALQSELRRARDVMRGAPC
jgi:hypothetical protein